MKRDKITGIALSAVLVFYMAFPVSSFVKPEKAEAIAPAIAAVTVFGTALTAMGVYVAGSTAAGYSANLNSVMAGFESASSSWNNTWSEYVSAQGGFEQAMQSAVNTDGSISLQTLSDNGFFDSAGTYTAYCVDNGTMVTGMDSHGTRVTTVSLNGHSYNMFSGSPSGSEYLSSQIARAYAEGYTFPIAYVLYNDTSSRRYQYILMYSASNELSGYSWGGGTSFDLNGSFRKLITYVKYDGTVISTNYLTSDSITIYSCDSQFDYYYLNSDAVLTFSNATTTVNEVDSDALGTYDSSIDIGATVAETPNVQAFDPTDEVLTAGFTSLDVVAADVGTIADVTGDIATDLGSILTAVTTTIGGALNDIKTGVNGLENVIGSAVAGTAGTVVTGVGEAVGALGDVVGDISTTLDSVWNGAQGWWADVLAWLGATPLAQLIAQIIAAINAGVLTLDAAIAAVQEWIGTAVLDIVGAIEAIQVPTIPEFEMPPFLDLEPYDGGNADGTASIQGFSAVIREKAPFAYMFAFVDGLSSVSGYTDTPNFRVEHTFEIFDQEYPFVIDAEPYLLYDLGGVTPAFLLRMSFSLSLCMGVLYASYRLGLKAVQGGD